MSSVPSNVYDVVMVFPDMGKTTLSGKDGRFSDCDTFPFHYQVPSSLSSYSLDELKGSNDLIEVQGWEDSFLEFLESSSGVRLVNTNWSIYNKLNDLGYSILIVLPKLEDFQLILSRIKERKGVGYDEFAWEVYFDKLFQQFASQENVVYLEASGGLESYLSYLLELGKLKSN